MRKIIILCLVGASALLLYIQKNNNNSIVKNITTIVTNPMPIATPFPFQELTVPYLRSRQYLSKLSELVSYSKEGSFTSYLTSYQSDGLKVNGLLTIPNTPKPEGGFPAIVFVHGYISPSIYETTTKYVDYVNYLARNGFVVFKIDLRGHGNSEGDAGGSYYSGDYIIDTLNAYSALQNADFVNPKRVGLWGHSMAGNVTFRSFAANMNIPALVIWAGAGYTYVDLQDYRLMDRSYRAPQESSERAKKRQELRDAYGEFSPQSEFWQQVPATNYLAGVKGAIQLNHAVDDSVVSVEYSRNLDKILETANIVHELNEYPSGGHNITGVYFTKAMQNTVEFFKKYL